MKKNSITLIKVLIGFVYAWWVWTLTYEQWVQYVVPVPPPLVPSVGSDFREPQPDLTAVAVVGGILACWITSELSRSRQVAGFVVAVEVFVLPLIGPLFVRVLSHCLHDPSVALRAKGIFFGMFLQVLLTVMLMALGWGGGVLMGRFLRCMRGNGEMQELVKA